MSWNTCSSSWILDPIFQLSPSNGQIAAFYWHLLTYCPLQIYFLGQQLQQRTILYVYSPSFDLSTTTEHGLLLHVPPQLSDRSSTNSNNWKSEGRPGICLGIGQTQAYLKDIGMTGLASAWAMARQRTNEYRYKVDAATRFYGVSPISDLTCCFCGFELLRTVSSGRIVFLLCLHFYLTGIELF